MLRCLLFLSKTRPRLRYYYTYVVYFIFTLQTETIFLLHNKQIENNAIRQLLSENSWANIYRKSFRKFIPN